MFQNCPVYIYCPVRSSQTTITSNDSCDENVHSNQQLSNVQQHEWSPMQPVITYDNVTESTKILIKLHRTKVAEEMIFYFKNEDITRYEMIVEFIDENAQDSKGVSRDAYSEFWQSFMLSSADGETVRVPSLCPQYGEEEWKAIGRILLKGFIDHTYWPIQLDPAFTIAMVFGEQAVNPDILKSSFLKFLTTSEKDIVESAINGSDFEVDELLDILGQGQCVSCPSAENILPTVLAVAHKILIQDTKYAMDAMGSACVDGMRTILQAPIEILNLYVQLEPTAEKVIKLLNSEPQTKEQNMCLSYLKKFIRGRHPVQLKRLLRFLTAADIICVDKIEISYIVVYGAKRSPIAHTCGPFLELPSTYVSYPDFRAEWENLLDSRVCLVMDIA